MLDGGGQRLGRRLGEQEDRRVDAGLAERDPLLDQRDRQTRSRHPRTRPVRPQERRARSRRP